MIRHSTGADRFQCLFGVVEVARFERITSNGDSGPGSLREAIENTNSASKHAQETPTIFLLDPPGGSVVTLVDEEMTPGSYRAVFDARGLPSGSYFYRLEAGAFSETRPMILLK